VANNDTKFDYKGGLIKSIILNITKYNTNEDYNYFKSLNLLVLEACGGYETASDCFIDITYSNGSIYQSGNPFLIEQFIYDNLFLTDIPYEDIEVMVKFLKDVYVTFPFLTYDLPPTQAFCNNLYEELANTVTQYQHSAHACGKNLLLLVADVHTAKDSFLINMLSLKAAAANHINNFYMEFANEADFNSLFDTAYEPMTAFTKLNIYAQSQLNMTISYVDPENENDSPLERNLAMNSKVAGLSKQTDAIYIVGGGHIAQLLASNEIKANSHILTIFPERYTNINSCETEVTMDSTEGHYHLATIIGNPFYLTYGEIYDLVA